MRGVTHYFLAAALVSLIPFVMQLSVYEKAFIIVVGAVAGILPDFIDFKIVRLLWPIDEEIIPEWPIPDTKAIAKRIADIIDRAWNEKRTITIQIHTIKTGPNTWRRWYIHLDPDKKKVSVIIGPIQTFGGRLFMSTVEEILSEKRMGEAYFSAPLKYDYKNRTIEVSILAGPTIAFKPSKDHVEVVFLPWHRYMSHSFILMFLLASVVFLSIWGMGFSLFASALYSAAFMVGYASHILSDHLGHMGSNLFWPITKSRTPGLKLTESADPYSNFAVFWLSITTLFWQMNAYVPEPIVFPWTLKLGAIAISVFYVVIIMILPTLLILILRHKYWRPSSDPYLENLLREELLQI